MRPTEPSSSRTVDLVELEQLMEQFAALETELEHIRAELAHTHRLATVGTLASTIAHEYHNILTPIVSYAQFALASPDDPQLMRKAVEKALTGAQRAAQISRSLLGFARDEPDAGPAPLRQAVDEAVACLGRPLEKDGIRLELDLPEVHVAMSELGLQQVLMNLILNARKAMRPTGGTLTITGRTENDELLLDVADTGPGIPPDMQSRLFEPFATTATATATATTTAATGTTASTGPDSTSHHAGGAAHADYDQAGQNRAGPAHAPGDVKPEKGTGLGLAICRDLLRQAEGRITVTSPPGQGATFHLVIPLADEGELHTT